MTSHSAAAPSAADAKALLKDISVHARPSIGRSVLELMVTAVPLALLLSVTWLALENGYWIGLLLAIPAGALLVRLFMIQHDCGHGSFFPKRQANDWVGRVIGVLTLTPYDYFRRSHALHHATTGNLDRRGMGDVDHADGAGISRAAAGATHHVPALPPPDRDVRHRPRLPVRAASSGFPWA